MTKKISLNRNETIIVAVPQNIKGAGYGNHLVWVYISNRMTDRLRVESLQPDEMSHEMRVLFDAGAVMCESLFGAVHVEKT